MVGDGPERSAVIYRAEKLNVVDDVLFVGKQANIADYLGVSDLFLLPSELESFGLAALEAQACEVPVIATRIGGIPEVVNDGESGYLSDVGDTAKMAEDALRLLEDDEMRRIFGARGRELAVQRYATEIIIPQYIAFYEKVLNEVEAKSAEAKEAGM
jgi:glycosyltransferase involved in cell wall biosynthesis